MRLELRGRSRLMSWDGCCNARDLGGYPAADGRTTRWAAIIRSDSLSHLTDAGCAAVVASGVRTIIDLRGPEEIAEGPNPFAQPGAHGITYINLPIVDPPGGPQDPGLADVYQFLLDRLAAQMAAIMTAIARAAPGSVVVHCVGGQDRSGLVSALLLGLVGVPRETIAADYALTAQYIGPLVEAFLARATSQEDRAAREQRVARTRPRAEVMLATLAHLDRRYSGVEAYLRQAGVPPDDLQRLRERLLDALLGSGFNG